MFYDLNLNQNFTDFSELKALDYSGFCLVQDEKDYLKTIVVKQLHPIGLPIYSRVNVEYSRKLDASSIKHLMKFNLVCITGVDNSNIAPVIKLNPDLIKIKPEEIKHIKKSFINTLKQKGIYVEIVIKDSLYGGKERITWMSNVRRLLKFGCANNLIISSGASIPTELKARNDIKKLLGVFGLSDDKITKILINSKNVLRNAALKRYAASGVVASNIEDGAFKKDFIIDYKK